MAEKKTNVLGMDVFQTAAIKRNYQNVKKFISQRKRLEEKVAFLQGQINELKEQTEDSDVYTLKLTQKVLGFPISSEKCIYYLEHPEEFEAFKAEHQKEEE